MTLLYRIARHLPEPLRRCGRSVTDRVTEWRTARRTHVLPAPLAGYRMRGAVPRQYRDGTYEPLVCALLGRLIQPGWNCVDAGAHVGYFTLLLARLAGETGRVTAFEAHPKNAAQLRKHLELNKFADRVFVVNKAVSDGATPSVDLFGGRNDSSCEWNILGHDTSGRATSAALRIPAVSLDACFAQGTPLDFVKMDIEGAEAMALRGMRRILQTARPLMLVEFHNEEAWAARQELLGADYRLYDVEKSCWIDDGAEARRAYLCLAAPADRLSALHLP